MTSEVTVKKLRYTGPSVAPITVAGTVTDDKGVVEVDDDIAKTLLAQADIWQAVTAAKKED